MNQILIPMGGGYSDLYPGMIQTILQNARDGQVNILILPTAYSTNPIQISEGERQVNLTDAERRRFETEEACKRAAPPDVTCSAVIAPVFTRDDASNPATLSLFDGPLSAVFILGGDQTVAMEAIMGTPLEPRLEELYNDGAIFAGTSAGCGVQAYNMLGGYNPNFAAGNALHFGAADMWNSPDRHGLTFGVQNAILDQHFFQRSRFARLVNAVTLPGVPHVGIGVDGYTGLHIRDGYLLGDVFGLYDVAVLDAETYHAADNTKYVSLAGDPNAFILSTRNILVHLLAQGGETYNLNTRQHSLGESRPTLERTFESLTLPEGAGNLFLSGYLGKEPAQSEILARFVEAGSGAAGKRILIVAAGFPSERSAQTNAESVAEALSVPTEILAIGKQTEPITIPDGIGGIIFIARDASLVDVNVVAPVKDAWLAGTPLLADNAAASVLGAYYSNHGPMPDETDLAEIAAQKSFLAGITEVKAGFGLLKLNIEPRVSDDNRWGRLFSVAHAHPEFITIGLNDNTALEITSSGATVLGDDGIFVFDLRTAQLTLGTNNGYMIANAMLDVFAPGESVQPVQADVNAVYQRPPLPAIDVARPTAISTFTAVPATVVPMPASTQTPTVETTAAVSSHNAIASAIPILTACAAAGLAAYLLFRKKRKL